MAFALANAIAYVEAVLAHGVAVDDFAPRLSWIFNTHTNFFEEIAKYRALRRMWATLMRERFGALDARSLQLRTHTQTGGSTLTLQQPENNIVRAALQALAAVLGGVQSLALSCYDEAIAIPTEHAQTLAVRTQQILAEEIGVTDTADPLGGSWYVECADRRARAAGLGAAGRGRAHRRRGGRGRDRLLPAGDRRGGLPRGAWRSSRASASSSASTATARATTPSPRPSRSIPRSPSGQIARLEAVRAAARRRRRRGGARAHCATTASAPRSTRCRRSSTAVRARATLGEICGAMRDVFGEYKPA